MKRTGSTITVLAMAATLAAVLILPTGFAVASTDANPSNPFRPFDTPSGTVLTVKGPNCTSPGNGAGGADVCVASNPFLTTNFATDHGNGQACETCHQPQLGWSTTTQFLRDQFSDSDGTAPQFRVNDAASDPRVCGTPTATSTSLQIAAAVNACVTSMTENQKRQAFQLNRDLGVVRIAIKLSDAQDNFTVSAPTTQEFGALPIPAGSDSQQPCVVQGATCVPTVSVFRRPLLTTNTFFDSSVLWDGRQNVCVEVTPPPGACSAATPLRTPLLENQTSGAAQTLLLTGPPTTTQEDMAAHFMTGIFTAMSSDNRAGRLDAHGANGGPQFLAKLAAGPVGPQLPPCTPLVEASKANSGAGNPPPACTAASGFNLYNTWLPDDLQGATTAQILAFCAAPARDLDGADADRVRVACGAQIFTNHPINDPVVGRDANSVPNARCTSCHAVQDVGDNANPLFLLPYTPGGGIGQKPDLFVGGATDASTDTFCPTHPTDQFCQSQTFNLPQFKERTGLLPLYTLTSTTGAGSIQLTDPGQALINHNFGSAGAMKPPQLRDLAPRGPFFHNGAAQTLDDLVDFYNQNFSIGLSAREHRELVAFLKAT